MNSRLPALTLVAFALSAAACSRTDSTGASGSESPPAELRLEIERQLRGDQRDDWLQMSITNAGGRPLDVALLDGVPSGLELEIWSSYRGEVRRVPAESATEPDQLMTFSLPAGARYEFVLDTASLPRDDLPALTDHSFLHAVRARLPGSDRTAMHIHTSAPNAEDVSDGIQLIRQLHYEATISGDVLRVDVTNHGERGFQLHGIGELPNETVVEVWHQSEATMCGPASLVQRVHWAGLVRDDVRSWDFEPGRTHSFEVRLPFLVPWDGMVELPNYETPRQPSDYKPYDQLGRGQVKLRFGFRPPGSTPVAVGSHSDFISYAGIFPDPIPLPE